MKINIQTESGEKEIDLKGLKGKHTREIWKYFADMTKKNDAASVEQYIDYLDSLASEISGLSVEELNDLDASEKAKITGYIVEKTQDTLGFTKLSSKQAN